MKLRRSHGTSVRAGAGMPLWHCSDSRLDLLGMLQTYPDATNGTAIYAYIAPRNHPNVGIYGYPISRVWDRNTWGSSTLFAL